jgi:TRAP-type transport system periplasmic protein
VRRLCFKNIFLHKNIFLKKGGNMEKGRLRSCFFGVLALTLVIIFVIIFVSPASAQQKQEKITLKIVYQQPIGERSHTLFKAWQDKVNSINPQRLEIKYLGSVEVIPVFEQVDAIRRGAVDMGVVGTTFYTGLCPEAVALQLVGADVTVPDLKKKGLWAIEDEIHRKKTGTTILGALWGSENHIMLLRKPVSKADVSGLKIRCTPIDVPSNKTLGATITVMPPEETFTALQSGLLDGISAPSVLIPDYKFEEVAKYIFYPFFPVADVVPIHCKADVWDKLPPDVKKMIMDPLLEMEQQVKPFFVKMQNDTINTFLKKGLQKTGATNDKESKEVYAKLVRATWKALVEERADPAYLPKINAIGKPALGIQ